MPNLFLLAAVTMSLRPRFCPRRDLVETEAVVLSAPAPPPSPFSIVLCRRRVPFHFVQGVREWRRFFLATEKTFARKPGPRLSSFLPGRTFSHTLSLTQLDRRTHHRVAEARRSFVVDVEDGARRNAGWKMKNLCRRTAVGPRTSFALRRD